MYDWFLVGEDFGFLAGIVAEWLAFGLGLGAIGWVLSVVIGFLWSIVRY